MINTEKYLSTKISNSFRIEETKQVLLKPHSFSYAEELLSMFELSYGWRMTEIMKSQSRQVFYACHFYRQ